jgi:hypothetical protein
MDESQLTKPKYAVLVASLLLAIVLFLAVIELFNLFHQGWFGWLEGWVRHLAVFIFTVTAIYLLNGRSKKVAELLQRFHLSMLFPALKEVIEVQKQRQANQLVAERMSLTLNFYKLKVKDPPVEPEKEASERPPNWLRKLWHRWRPALEKGKTTCYQRSVAEMPPIDKIEEDRVRILADRLAVCGVVTETGFEVPSDQLRLLYHEQHRLETRLLFNPEKSDHAILARILLDSDQLPERRRLSGPPWRQTFSVDEIVAIFNEKEMDDFHLLGLREKLKNRQMQIAAYKTVVDKMFHTLEYYGLPVPTAQHKQILIDSAPDNDNETKMISHCATAVGRLLSKPKDVLELLYKELRKDKGDTLDSYQCLVKDGKLPDLAYVLLGSPWLPKRWQASPFGKDEVVTILKKMGNFQLRDLQNNLLLKQRQIKDYQVIVDGMNKVLVASHLRTVGKEKYNDLMKNAPDSDNHETLINHCAKAIAKIAKKPEGVMQILYRDHHRLGQLENWKQHIPRLASVLKKDSRLQRKQVGENQFHLFSQDEIRCALEQMTLYSLEGLVEQLLKNEEKHREGQATLRRMEYTLNYYDIFGRLQQGVASKVNGRWEFTSHFQHNYYARLPNRFNADDYINCCTAEVASSLAPGKDLPASNELLQLLYCERNGVPTAVLWFERREDLAPGLAEVLAESGKLPDPKITIPYRPANLEAMLRPHEDYSLNLIRDEVDHLNVLWRQATKFRDFLKINKIDSWGMNTNDLLELLKPLPVEQSQLPQLITRDLDMLMLAGEKSLQKSFLVAGSQLKSYCQVATAIFLANEPDHRSRELLAQVCIDMGQSRDDTAIRMSLAYVDLMADLEGRQEASESDFVTVRSLIETWAERDRYLRDNLKGYQIEIESWRNSFKNGQWHTHLWKALTQTLKDLKKANAPVGALVKNRNQLVESLRRIFMRLDVRTIERYLEARTITAYLITFDSTLGSLAGLLDTLMLRPETIQAARPATRQQLELAYDKLQKLKVHLWDKQGNWIYNFRQYTNNSRIGVLPSGWNLEEFSQVFSKDIETVTGASDNDKAILVPGHNWATDLKATEVILHRFGLRHHYALKLEKRSEKAVSNMKGLFATQINLDDLLSTVSYEHLDIEDLVAAIIQGTISELARDNMITGSELAKLERHDKALKLALLLRSGRSSLSIPELGVLKKDLNDDFQVERIIQNLHNDVLNNTLERIIRRHSQFVSDNKNLQIRSEFLAKLTSMIKENYTLSGMIDLIKSLLNSSEFKVDDWALDLIILAVLIGIDFPVLEDQEQVKLDEDIASLSDKLAEDASDNVLDETVILLADVMVDLIPRINPARCPQIAATYLGTLRDVAKITKRIK